MIKDPERRRLPVALPGIPAIYMKIDGEQLAHTANTFLFNDDPMSSIQDNELQAAVQVRQAIVFMRQEQPLTAVQYLNGALDLINGEGLPLLRGNILTIRSESYAKAQRSQEAWRSIGLAERVLGQTPLVSERSHRSYNAALVSAHKGVDALLSGDYRRALALIEKSLKTYNPTFTPGRARLLARQAEACYGLQEIDNCTMIAEEALTLAQTVGATWDGRTILFSAYKRRL